jgi:hypothetical protein
MKKLSVLIIMFILMMALTTFTFAGGGKVRGEEGNGEVNQVQVQDPPPFN